MTGSFGPKVYLLFSIFFFSPRLLELNEISSLFTSVLTMESKLSIPMNNQAMSNVSKTVSPEGATTRNFDVQTNNNLRRANTSSTAASTFQLEEEKDNNVSADKYSQMNNTIPLVDTCREIFSRRQASCADQFPSPIRATRDNSGGTNSSLATHHTKLWSPSFCKNFRNESPPGKEMKKKKTKDLLQLIHFRQALEEECWDDDNHNSNQTFEVNHPGARTTLDGCSVGIIFPRSLVSYCSCGVWGTNNIGTLEEEEDEDHQITGSSSNEGKNISFFFQGKLTKQRRQSWLMSYIDEKKNLSEKKDASIIVNDKSSSSGQNNLIVFTDSGRSIRKKTGRYDFVYYDRLMQSRFALAPDGNYPWTYRFLEAIMCGAIPVVPSRGGKVGGGRGTPLEQEVGYEYCVDGQPCPFMDDEDARREAARRNWLYFLPRHSLVEFEDEQ